MRKVAAIIASALLMLSSWFPTRAAYSGGFTVRAVYIATGSITANGDGTYKSVVPTSYAGSLQIPAGSMRVGTTYVASGHGVFTHPAASSMKMRALAGSTVLAEAIATVNIPIWTGNDVHFMVTTTCRSTGASGTMMTQLMLWNYNSSSNLYMPITATPQTSAVTLDTTAAQTLDIQVGDSSTGSPTFTITNLVIEQIY